MSAIDQPRLLQQKAKELHRALRKMLHEFKIVSGIDLLHSEKESV